MDNCIIFDWLTFSSKSMSFSEAVGLLGMESSVWKEENGSRLRYQHRMSCGGISIHYTDFSFEDDSEVTEMKRFNSGCCIEMSGQGCREFESFGNGDWVALLSFIYIKRSDCRVTRIDLAYDDFDGVIPLAVMAEQARRFEFTARSQHLQVIEDADCADQAHLGITVNHGSRSSDLFIRCYDKRVEKKRYDLQHWVRFEIQIRGDDAAGFLRQYVGSGLTVQLGDLFAGIVTQYLEYKVPADDHIKSRWLPAPWWSAFLGACKAISIHSKKDVEYNKSRLDRYVYKQNHNCLKTAILHDGSIPNYV